MHKVALQSMGKATIKAPITLPLSITQLQMQSVNEQHVGLGGGAVMFGWWDAPSYHRFPSISRGQGQLLMLLNRRLTFIKICLYSTLGVEIGMFSFLAWMRPCTASRTLHPTGTEQPQALQTGPRNVFIYFFFISI